MNQEDLQRKFFDYAVQRYSPGEVLEEMKTTLGIQKGAAYKRINGTTALSTYELVTLARKFRISLDALFHSADYVSFLHPFGNQDSNIDFLNQFVFFLKPAKEMENCVFTYLANELPVFHYFEHKYIFNFLLSIWSHLHWSDQKLMIKDQIEITPQVTLISNEISQYYNMHEATEIWNNNMLANLYQQINFCISIRAFEHSSYIIKLLKDIETLIKRLKEVVESGGKDSKKKIYINDYGNYLNLVLFASDKLKSTFVGYDVPKFIVSYDHSFYDYSYDWLRKVRKKSVLISEEGYQNKELFFLKLERDFNAFSERVEKLISVYYE